MSDQSNSKKLIEYAQMKEFYELAYQSAMNALFKTNFEKHGWRYDDFMLEYSAEEEVIDFMIDPNATLH
jgi:hypothetical protein